ncbi:hypothetical protein [Acuticoccus sp. I52.16.1]|uniref:hypothetical protein n=1 Tax=Acuticoccus sp. I52.16.1 TaxID=2928472 RepID=UPI001FD5A18B|nr:hypothetical protein [Acuticoccus sp. I52.16.1]UOM34005.1 hypothetical protein MRB58_19545 [Acuticoccus sp. I52.16.1]
MARPATCVTDDDGRYACDFRYAGGDGSFTVGAPGKPFYTVSLTSPGVADAFADFGTGRNVPLPGPFLRSERDRACWVSDATGYSICVY